jgi:hypothetical protein
VVRLKLPLRLGVIESKVGDEGNTTGNGKSQTVP